MAGRAQADTRARRLPGPADAAAASPETPLALLARVRLLSVCGLAPQVLGPAVPTATQRGPSLTRRPLHEALQGQPTVDTASPVTRVRGEELVRAHCTGRGRRLWGCVVARTPRTCRIRDTAAHLPRAHRCGLRPSPASGTRTRCWLSCPASGCLGPLWQHSVLTATLTAAVMLNVVAMLSVVAIITTAAMLTTVATLAAVATLITVRHLTLWPY